MKKKSLPFLITAGLALLVVFSCENELPMRANYMAYTFANLDANGGTWKPILLSAPTQIAVNAPEAVTSAAYKNELAALKAATTLSNSQQRAVDYWTNNPLLRWNEIALELAAKYNLIPGPNPDGTYTLPNAANPAGPPPFPFAHPPYVCRMLAYLSVAQFDGLITAWHYKYTYNRPAPSVTDNSIPSAYGNTSLPSYPSDGAVIATVSHEILRVMFPLEAEYLDAKAQEHLASLKWAGMNVDSDIEAGKYIGTEVRKVVMARAATDGMSRAQTPIAKSDSIKLSAFERYGWQWDNQEVPQRPVGLTPLFGQVKLWNVPSLIAVRPAPPPAPGTPQFEKDAEELRHIAKNLTQEQRRIANWWSDGLSTYTPPGHWNRFAKEYVIRYKLNPLRTARVFAYMNQAIMDAGISCWDAKYYYHYPRPIQTMPGFKTILGTPNFPSYTSGHSTFSAAAAEVLSHFFPADAAQFRSWALEAAESRIYGGIHYRFDAEVGIDQGKKVAQYTIDRIKADGAD
jgi:hypothetical protein